MADKELLRRAEEAGVEVDKRWSDETLRERVEEAEDRQEPPAPPRETPLMKIELKRDTWDADGNRQEKGKVITVPVRDGVRAIEQGRARSVEEE